MANFALLLGLIGFPAWLLWLGHRLRDRSAVQKGAFWGGVIAHTLAILVALTALQVPGVVWTGGVRELIAFWSLLLGGVAGAIVGALRAQRKYGTRGEEYS